MRASGMIVLFSFCAGHLKTGTSRFPLSKEACCPVGLCYIYFNKCGPVFVYLTMEKARMKRSSKFTSSVFRNNEETEGYIYLSRNFGKFHINYFSQYKTLFIFTPTNPIRQAAIFLVTNHIFNWTVAFVIFVNCIFLALPPCAWIDTSEYVFIAIYILELMIRVIARGFVMHRRSYLRDPWNCVDFAVITVVAVPLFLQLQFPKSSYGNVSGLRTFRVLLGVRTLTMFPGLKTIVNALIQAVRIMSDVMFLQAYCLFAFSLFSLQLYKGILRQKCVKNIDNVTSEYYALWIQNASNWQVDENDQYAICGNTTMAQSCERGFTCLGSIGENPNYGYTNFDHVGWAILSSFQLLTLDYWEDIFLKVLEAAGVFHGVLVIFIIFYGSYYLVNLMLAVMALSYKNEATRAKKMRAKEKDTFLNQLRRLSSRLTNFDLSQIKARFSFRHSDSQTEHTPASCAEHNQEDSRYSIGLSSASGYIEKVGVCDKLCTYLKACPRALVNDPLFDLAIIICIILNTCMLAAEHHGQPELMTRVIFKANIVFTSVFIFEAIVKIMALKYQYFSDGWNCFDFVLVVVSIVDIGLETFGGMNVIRTYRMLRLFRLTQSWITMRIVMRITVDTMGQLLNLTFVLSTIVFIFTVTGYQLFRESYANFDFQEGDATRWHFKDFFHSFLMVFRILCGVWIEPMWECMRAAKELCLVVFLPTVIIGNLMFINLILALLLNAFASTTIMKHRREMEAAHPGRLRARLKRVCPCVCDKEYAESADECSPILSPTASSTEHVILKSSPTETAACGFNFTDYREGDDGTPVDLPLRPSIIKHWTPDRPDAGKDRVFEDHAITESGHEVHRGSEGHRVMFSRDIDILGVKESPRPGHFLERPNTIFTPGNDSDVDCQNARHAGVFGETEKTLDKQSLFACRTSAPSLPSSTSGSTLRADLPPRRFSKVTSTKTLDALPHSMFGGPFQGRDVSQLIAEDSTSSVKSEYQRPKSAQPPSCYPEPCRRKILETQGEVGSESSMENPQCRCWLRFRTGLLRIVDNRWFEYTVLFLIFVQVIGMAFEDVNMYTRPTVRRFVDLSFIVLTSLFYLDMVMRMFAYGLAEYFTRFWTILDFVANAAALTSLVLNNFVSIKFVNIVLRTLVALRPLRLIARWQSMNFVVHSLIGAIPSIFNVFLVIILCWFVFSVVGVHFFKGKFYKCVNASTGQVLYYNVTKSKTECESKGQRWENSKINFDNAAIGFLALFQVATFEGWLEVIQDVVDSTKADQQPRFENNLFLGYTYIVGFIIVGSFFSLKLLVSVIIDNYIYMKTKYEHSGEDLARNKTEFSIKKMEEDSNDDSFVDIRPKNAFQLKFYNLVTMVQFEMAVTALIIANMIVMAVEHFRQPAVVDQALKTANIVFSALYALEAIAKIIGLRNHYFTDLWNLFDFFIVIISGVEIFFDNVLSGKVVNPALLRVIRIFRIGRVLRLIKSAKGIRRLLYALTLSLPSIFSIMALLVLVVVIYAIIGMFAFGDVKLSGGLNNMVNFQTFLSSFLLLVRLATAAGWNDILDSLLIHPPYCDPESKILPDGTRQWSDNGDCGYYWIAIPYMVSYLVCVNLVIINMYVAIILENFYQVQQQEEMGVTKKDLSVFFMIWAQYDPKKTQYIPFSELTNFVNDLQRPLRIPKPNQVTIANFDLDIYKGDRVHCLQVLRTVVDHFLGEKDETEELNTLHSQIDAKFYEVFKSHREMEALTSSFQKWIQIIALRRVWRTWVNYTRKRIERRQEQERRTSHRKSGRTNMMLSALWGNRIGSTGVVVP